ncbi:MAG: LacI family transcriptional regulator [Rhodococcus sp. (in: high G+C Gram-positive bacteria)]|nr:LacI family transcriptional regulator [Rhodococcus sp. (in: high G+C Gram-positive bacteria)]
MQESFESVKPAHAGYSRATIAAVAELAGVGLSTVSRVVRGAPGVSDMTRRKVEDAIRATGYQVNGVARTLRNNGTLGLVALVIPDSGDPYFNEIYLHLQGSFLQRGESLLVGCHVESLSLQKDLLRQMVMNRPAAIVLVPAPGTIAEDVEWIQAQGIPVIILDRPIDGVDADTVIAGNEAGAELLVSQFEYREGEKIAIVSLPTTIWTQKRRFIATRDALRDRGIDPVVVIEEPALTAPTGSAFAKIVELGVETVLSMSIPPAMGVLRLQKTLGTAPVRIGCFDRHPMFDLVQPEIVSVIQSSEEVTHQVKYHIERRRENPRAATITSVITFQPDGEGRTLSGTNQAYRD